MKNKTITVQINQHIINKEVQTLGMRQEGFITETLTIGQWAGKINKGFAFRPTLEGGHSNDDFKETFFLALDIEGNGKESDINNLAGDPFIQQYCTFLYTSPSHNLPGKGPRCRAVFVLDRPITNGEDYRAIHKHLTKMFKGDVATSNPARMMYGSKDAQWHYAGAFLPKRWVDTTLDQIRESQKVLQPAVTYKPKTVKASSDRTKRAKTNYIRSILRWIAGQTQDKHRAVYTKSRQVAGYVSFYNLDQSQMLEELREAVQSMSGVKDWDNAFKAMQDGWENGLSRPIATP